MFKASHTQLARKGSGYLCRQLLLQFFEHHSKGHIHEYEGFDEHHGQQVKHEASVVMYMMSTQPCNVMLWNTTRHAEKNVSKFVMPQLKASSFAFLSQSSSVTPTS